MSPIKKRSTKSGFVTGPSNILVCRSACEHFPARKMLRSGAVNGLSRMWSYPVYARWQNKQNYGFFFFSPTFTKPDSEPACAHVSSCGLICFADSHALLTFNHLLPWLDHKVCLYCVLTRGDVCSPWRDPFIWQDAKIQLLYKKNLLYNSRYNTQLMSTSTKVHYRVN